MRYRHDKNQSKKGSSELLSGWNTFIKRLNVSIYKTKNMLSIIPIDTLASVWNIKQLLDIDIKAK